MVTVKTIETKLDNLFKGLPNLSDKSKEALAKAWPWIALVFGILQLFAAYGLSRLTSVVSTYATIYAVAQPLSSLDKLIIYLGVLVLIVDGVILLMAYPHLKTRSRRGWDLLFLGSLVNVAYSVVELFISDRGFGSFIFSLIGSAVGFYLLFQVRDKYKVAGTRNPKT